MTSTNGLKCLSSQTGFSEELIGSAYDRDFSALLQLWSGSPVQHAALFEGVVGPSADSDCYRTAARRTTERLAAEAGVGPNSRVLDVGCGSGETATYLARRLGCAVVGVDLSVRQIEHAAARGARLSVEFRQASATSLPFSNGEFTHVISMDTLYHVLDKPRAYAEMRRVLCDAGTLALTDFLRPANVVSPGVQAGIYNRLMFNGGDSVLDYQASLVNSGFEIRLARDISLDLRRSYLVLARIARERLELIDRLELRRSMRSYVKACMDIQAAIGRREFGWGMFVVERAHDLEAL
ncbi:class I SAM-dependent methyltransferase [Amycolatopsis sp. cmx-4-68]|uniref:class I SAM-dependent methyltransferase n=1 Tax=Amycolatopsis sp. cmx-4-68 TaxID=2790938 RepID=UPI00397CA520